MSEGLEVHSISKSFGSVSVLHDVSLSVLPGEVTCLLGDNGAGKSTIIKVLSGVHRPDTGSVLIDGDEVVFRAPRDALDAGVATVFQDLAVVPILPVFRNFVMGAEPTRGWGPFRLLDRARAQSTARAELAAIGIELDDVSRPIATLSGGQRQCVAIARAVHRGARFLILDEPTSALGVRQSNIVLSYLTQVKRRGIGSLLVTHNPSHAYAVGDRFVLLEHGRVVGTWAKQDITLDQLIDHMSSHAEITVAD